MVNVPTTNPAVITQPRQAPAPPAQPNPYQTPGSDTYDWYSINDALRNAGLNGWQIAGAAHTPVNSGQWVSNPSYDKNLTAQENADAGNGQEFIWRQGQTYQIGVVNPQTHQMLQLTLAGGPDPNDKTKPYQWTVVGRQDQGKLDATQPGYTGIQRLPFSDGHEELWGTNSATGAFEKLPSQPGDIGATLGTTPKGWNDIKQIDDGQGHQIWVGTDPSGKPMQQVPGSPTINTGKYVPGSVKQVQVGGKLVYRGQNPQTGEWEDIPSLGSEVVQPKTTTVGKNVYTTDANGNLVLATAIAQPREGDDQWVDVGGGYAKHQVFSNGDWHDDVNTPQKAVSPAVQRTEAAIKPAGTRYKTPMTIGGQQMLVDVVADGNGGYTIPDDTRASPIPGAPSTSVAQATSTEQPTLVRYDPSTNQYTEQPNPNYQPTDYARRTAQLSQQASQKLAELQARISPDYTQAQAQSDFDQWWNTNVEPAKQQMAAQQQQDNLKVLAEQRAQSEQSRANYATAATIGQNAADTQAKLLPYMAGPGWGKLVGDLANAVANPGKNPAAGLGISPDEIAAGVQFQAPDLQAISQQATAQALQHISPTAASIANGPGAVPSALQQAQGIDFNTALNRTSYQFSGAPQAVQAVSATPAVGATSTGAAAPQSVQSVYAPPRSVNPSLMPGYQTPTGVGFTSYPNAINPSVMPGFAPYQYQGSF